LGLPVIVRRTIQPVLTGWPGCRRAATSWARALHARAVRHSRGAGTTRSWCMGMVIRGALPRRGPAWGERLWRVPLGL
jgi:hypothetical protein